ncbi:MAG: polysaccharide biosynthesis protein PslG [Solirubrobacterales bacterium]|nr:polysaccharide biosynthesis protein PslG [Solirubrobacterales bacterium]
MHSSVLRSRITLLCATMALCLVAAGVLAHDAVAKRKADKASAPVAQQLRGVNLTPNWEWPGSAGMDDSTSAREIQSACNLGADLVRFTVKWNRLEPVQGRIDLGYASRIDQVLAQASSCQIKVLVTLMITPCWAAADSPLTHCPPGAGTFDPPNDPATYGSIVERILQRWPAIYALEVWNEPNLTAFFHGSVSDYAALANAATAAADRVGSATKMLVGSIGAADVGYLRQLYAAGIHGYDGISIHPYDFQMSAGFTPRGRWKGHRDLFETRVQNIHRTMLAAGDRSTGLWLTEFGYSVCPTQPYCVQEGRQARSLADSFRAAASWRYVRGLTSYDLRDAGDDANVWDNRYGLLRRDFSPRAGYWAVRTTLRRLDAGNAAAAGAKPAAVKRKRR